MVILVNPMWSVEHLNKDSNYVHIKKIIERYSKIYPDTYWIIPFPVKHFKYYDDGFFDNPNVIREPYTIPLAKKINNITFDGAFFNNIIEKYCINLIYNQIPEVTGQLKSIDSHFSSNITVVNQHHYIYHDSLPYPLENQMQYVYWQIVGDILADINIYNSEYTKQMVLDNVKKYMPNYEQLITDNSVVLHMGLYDRNDVVKNKKFKKFTFLYNHRLQQYKNWQITFDIFDELYKKHDFQVALCPVGPDNVSIINKKPYTRVYDVPTQKDYYDIMSRCHANTFNSQYETFCISIFESMMHGLALCVPNATTMPELLGSESWQMFSDTKEQKDKLKTFLQDESFAYICGMKNKETVQNFSLDKYCTNLNKIFVNELNKNNYYKSLRPHNRDKLNKYLNKYKKISGSDLKKIRRFINLSNQSVPNHRLVNIMYHAGYTQVLKNNQTFFIDKK